MDFFRLFYWFTNNGGPTFTKPYFHNPPCLILAFLVLVLCAVGFSYWFYFIHTTKDVTKTARKREFIVKGWVVGMIVCFVLSELMFALFSKIPNANILKPIIGERSNILIFCLLNATVYFTIFFGLVSFLIKVKSKNAKKIWFF